MRLDNSNHSDGNNFVSDQSKQYPEQRCLEQTDSRPSRSSHREWCERLSLRLREDIRNYQTLCQNDHPDKLKRVQRHLQAAQRYLESDEFGACDFELRAIERVIGG